METSILLFNAKIIDGTGTPPYPGMVAIEKDKILYAGPRREGLQAKKTIDLKGRLLVPGFIDMHGHSDLHLLKNPKMEEKITQGITTEVVGNCGMGVYPMSENQSKRELLSQMATDILGTFSKPWPWYDVTTYMEFSQKQGCRTRLVPLQAHAPLRIAAMEGNPNRAATQKEIAIMVELLNQSYDQGAAGLSSGLYYAPCLFANRDEILALLDVTSDRDRMFAVHHRCEGDGVLDSLEEVLGLAFQSHVRIEISHLKAIGKRNQHLVTHMLKLLDFYANKGLEVGFDQYPYTFGSTSLYSLLPPRYLSLSRDDLMTALGERSEREKIKREIIRADGWDSIVSLCGWEAISVMHLDGKEEMEGKSLSSLAAIRGIDPFDLLFDLLMEGPHTAVMADITQTEESLTTILSHHLGCFGTDALYSGKVRHPRSFSATRHLLTRYGKELKTIPLEQLIAKMTSIPAKRLRLGDRGIIKTNLLADLVVLDMDSMDDNGYPGKGIDFVLKGGEVVFESV